MYTSNRIYNEEIHFTVIYLDNDRIMSSVLIVNYGCFVC